MHVMCKKPDTHDRFKIAPADVLTFYETSKTMQPLILQNDFLVIQIVGTFLFWGGPILNAPWVAR